MCIRDREVDAHRGNIWTAIYSLRREDAQRLGFDTAARWRDLLRSQTTILAEGLKIPPTHLKWYAAFHNEGHHPHVHLIAYSTNPKEGFLTKQGMEKIRSALAQEIFRQDLVLSLIHIWERNCGSLSATSPAKLLTDGGRDSSSGPSSWTRKNSMSICGKVKIGR